MSSVSNVFAPDSPRRPRDQPLWVGAVKANLGHGEAASGVTALIKTLLVLREKKLPPHVFKGELNKTFPNLDERNLHSEFLLTYSCMTCEVDKLICSQSPSKQLNFLPLHRD